MDIPDFPPEQSELQQALAEAVVRTSRHDPVDDYDWAILEQVRLTKVFDGLVLVERQTQPSAVVVYIDPDGRIEFNGVYLEIRSLGPWLGLLDEAQELVIGQSLISGVPGE